MARDVLTRPARDPDRTVVLGPGEHQLYDVWAPTGDPVATVVLVHGGFWRAQWDRTHLRPAAVALAEQGYVVALPEYRRTGMPGGTWPGPGQDVAAALAAIRADANLPAPVVLVGHSAGGHLAVWLLHHPESTGLAGAISLAGAVSLAGCLDLRMVGRLNLDGGAADDLMADLGDWLQVEKLDADPMDLGPTPAPVRAVHGSADEQVPVAVSQSWLRHCGTPGRDSLTLLDGVDHFDLIDPASTAWPSVLHQVAELTAQEPA